MTQVLAGDQVLVTGKEWMMLKAMRPYTMAVVGFIISIQASFAYGFQYGQCLLDRADSFNKDLREYKNVAYTKAAIKKISLEKYPGLLKWNYDTTRLIYDLVILHPDLIRLSNIYKVIAAKSPQQLIQVQNFFDDAAGHLALAQIDDAESESLENQKSVSDLILDLETMTKDDPSVASDIAALKTSLETDLIKDALGDLYDRIQEASVGASPVEPDSINQWISVANEFQASLVPKICLNGAQVSKDDKLSKLCEDSKVEDKKFKEVISNWRKTNDFPDEEKFYELAKNLPSLLHVKFPGIKNTYMAAEKVLEYHYVRTIEDFLFSRANIAIEHVQAWIKKDPNYTIMVRQANLEKAFQSEKDPAVKLFRYILSKERVLGNAFDHFVWSGQTGNEYEKTVDGIARTLYGEAESCQNSGARQFEAIASIIAARSVSVDHQNIRKGKFQALLHFDFLKFNPLSDFENGPLTTYQQGASDFGRNSEVDTNPLITEMPTPAQVVSRPGQFSVWKIGKEENLGVDRWINFPSSLGYPKLKITVYGPLGKDVDPAQRKVLCPNNNIFNRAVEVAEELMEDYNAYPNKYRFYQKGKRVVPYFYTHGAGTFLDFAKQITQKPTFAGLTDKGVYKELPIYVGSKDCINLRLYQPKVFKVSKKPVVKKKKSKKRRR